MIFSLSRAAKWHFYISMMWSETYSSGLYFFFFFFCLIFVSSFLSQKKLPFQFPCPFLIDKIALLGLT